MPAAEAAQGMAVPEGFKVSVFAAEPDVENPVAMAWDARGRMWVAENFTYAERQKRFDLALRDRVIILEDRDHDGRAETRRVFTDTVQMLTSVETGRGGVWLMCPPQLLFVPDANGDDVPDGPPQVMLDGFTVSESNYHNFANGLRWGPDGWLYGRCGHSCPGLLGVPGTPAEKRVPIKGGLWRFHPGRKVVEVLTHGTTNPWGHDWDANGEGFFINTVNGHLWHLMAGGHFKESGGMDPNPEIYERQEMIADHWHFDTKAGWHNLSDKGADALGGGHAHVGMMICQGTQWPAGWEGKLLTLNLHGRRVNVERLERLGSGYVGKHEPDILKSADPWFRGIDLSTGPDGSVYLLDWSDTGECHESTGVHRQSGRVFRVTHGDPMPADFSLLAGGSEAAVVERILKEPNAWFERQWRTGLASRGVAPELLLQLKRVALDVKIPVPQRLRALWALNTTGPVEKGMLSGLLTDEDEHVRVWVIRLLTDEWPLDTVTGPLPGAVYPDVSGILPALVALAEKDTSGLVRLALASVLQQLSPEKREPLALALAARNEDAADPHLPHMVWAGSIPMGRGEPAALVRLARVCHWLQVVKWLSRSLAGRIDSAPEAVNQLLSIATEDQIFPVLTGLRDGLTGRRKAAKPAGWDAFALKAQQTSPEAVQALGTLFGDGVALAEIKRLALDKSAETHRRQTALASFIEARPPELREVCEGLLSEPVLNLTAVRGLSLFEDEALARNIVRSYQKFRPADRPALLETLVSRISLARALLTDMAAGKIPKTDLTPFHARQIGVLNDAALSQKLKDVWGEVRESSKDKRRQIGALKADLTPDVLNRASLGQGRVLFETLCTTCHTLYGSGGKLGPDLTGSGRANLDYLLENIVDPSALVSADHRLTILTLKDGRTLAGVIAGENERTVTLRTLSEEVTAEHTAVQKRETPPQSLMPEGLLTALQPDQVRDVIAYLMYPVQVPRP